ncbi:M20/M25/M40 family metallo-hydrolase [Bacillus carboniphilus]|uniref:M20/M25/M40 family metallo-hydrolase n=1 Tax=Bacillus carboniphilus TaxID=86663 RepID=A0ABY9JUX3_9BACI|nr:M20/M25/M40 family metallo-hydrolase [Bacillus carboniphilus]WLR42225.1 M20/M25/M40 family metallo-hydrolase [Bacillus carboniphilus]
MEQRLMGGRPHLGINAIDVLSSLVNTVNTLRFNPKKATNVKFTQLMSGKGSVNVIPDYGTFAIDVRSDSNKELKKVLDKIEKMINYTAEMYEAEIKYDIKEGVPAPNYDERLVEIASQSIIEVLGEKNLVDPIFTPGGEDFHQYAARTGVNSIYLAIGADVSPGLHDPNMTFEKGAMMNGVHVVTKMVEKLLS